MQTASNIRDFVAVLAISKCASWKCPIWTMNLVVQKLYIHAFLDYRYSWTQVSEPLGHETIHPSGPRVSINLENTKSHLYRLTALNGVRHLSVIIIQTNNSCPYRVHVNPSREPKFFSLQRKKITYSAFLRETMLSAYSLYVNNLVWEQIQSESNVKKVNIKNLGTFGIVI